MFQFPLVLRLVGLCLLLIASAAAQDDPGLNEDAAPATVARLLRVPLPVQGLVDEQVRRAVEQILAELPDAAGPRPIVVLEFQPVADGQGSGSTFGRCLDLARFLASQATSSVRLVAYVPQNLTGHAVLVALACEEIVMHPDAQFGDAGETEVAIDDALRQAYQEIAGRRRTVPAAVALGLLDPALQVQRVTTGAGTRYVLSDEVAALRQSENVQSIDTVIPAGEPGLLPADQLRLEYHFVSHLAADRQQLAQALKVSPRDLRLDPSLGGDWRAVRFDLQGAVTSTAVDRIIRGIEDRLRQGSTNFICLAIDSVGGSLTESLRLANYLADLDPTKVRTVAYVAEEARGDAALVAVACDELILHDDAVLGGEGGEAPGTAQIQSAQRSIQRMMGRKGRRWSLPVALIDPELSVSQYRSAGDGQLAFFCREEWQMQADPEAWQRQDEVKSPGGVMELQGSAAVQWQLARRTVPDFAAFRQTYQLAEEPELAEPNWAQELVAALASPQVAAGLLFIGFFAMMAEISAPGVGIGGFIASLCFLLFFWSNFLQGTAGWLEVLLFVTGFCFIALEIFVLPGLGIFGVGGAFLVLLALVLASQTFVIPQNDYQFRALVQSFLTVLGALAGVITSGFVLRKQLERAPFLRRLQLVPPTGEAQTALERRQAIVNYDHLLDQAGRTTTRLTPAGKAEFSGELVDVISEGSMLPKGQAVRVVSVSGNRVVVRES